MKSNIVIGTIFFTMIAVPGAYATTQSDGSTLNIPTTQTTATSTPTAEPTVAPSPSPTATSTPEPQPTATSTPVPTSSPTYAPGMAPGEHGGWLLVMPDGRAYGGVMVCTPEVCGQTGSGSFIDHLIKNREVAPGTRFVLQTLQDPVEAKNSSNGIGNVAGYNEGRYNFETNRWTISDDKNYGSPVYEIPLAYPGTDRGGNKNPLICIDNCPVIEPTPSPSPSVPEESETPAPDDQDSVTIQERRVSVKPSVVNNAVVINKKLNDKVFKNQVRVVATKGNKKKVWTQQVSGKIVSIKIPRKYLFWNISIRYVVG